MTRTPLPAREGACTPQRLCGPNEFRRVSTIKTVAERQRISFRFQTQGRQLGKELANDMFVFFWLKTACAVNQSAAGLQQTEYSACDGQLFVRHSSEIFRSQSPSHIDASAHYSGVCALRF